MKKNKLLPAGRELDAIISEKFFNLLVVKNKKGGWSVGPADYYDSSGELILSNPLPQYSTDIASAWEIVNKLKETFCVTVTSLEPICEIRYYCKIIRHNGMGDFTEWQSSGDSEAHAICLCTLKMLE